MSTIAFRTTPTLHKVVDRYFAICDARNWGKEERANRLTITMDLAAANGVNGNPRLNLGKLLNKFDDFNFLHDIVGIQRHINRETGKIEGGFLARCAIHDKD